MAEGFKHSAGGGNRLSIVRYGRDQMSQRELTNNTGGAVMPGEAVMVTEDGNGNPVFEYHDGSTDATVYVVCEARGRGMDAQTDDGYADGEGMVAANASGGAGLHLALATGETVVNGDTIGVDSGAADGTFTSASADYNEGFAEADEDRDLSGASDPALVATEVSN